jgi:hypothetical protein
VTSQNTITALPLFYQHVISTVNLPRVDPEADDFTLASGVILVDAQLLDINRQPIKTSAIKIDLTNGIIYNNLLSEFSTTNNYTVYLIKYTVNNNGQVTTFFDLLDNETVYKVATFEDLTETLTIINDGRKVYLIEEDDDGFRVTLPVSGTYTYRSTALTRIRIVPPVPSDSTESWFVRVSNGTFFTTVLGDLNKYYISEFLNQTFTPELPFKKSILEKSTILSQSLIKLDRTSIYQDTDLDLYIEILINDADDNGVAAFTTDASIVGNIATNNKAYEKWSLISKRGIKSIDHRTGYIEIEGVKLKSSYEVTSTYYFRETFYEFSLVNFNPISNREALTTRTSLFIDPDNILVTKDQTLFFVKSDRAGKVIESNWDEFDNDTQLHSSSKILYYEQLPYFLTTGIDEIGEPNYVDPSTIEYFINTFTVEGTQSGIFLVLGDVTVSENLDVTQAQNIDARRRGGGIINTEFDSLLETHPELAWYWDEGYWDGIPYPGNASYLVEVPVTLVNGAGGIFNQQQIRDIIGKHTAAGIYPVSKAYGIDTTITGLQPGNTSITLFWDGGGL